MMLFSILLLMFMLLVLGTNNLVLRGTIMDLEDEIKHLRKTLMQIQRPEVASIVYKRPERTQEERERDAEAAKAQRALWSR